MFTIGNHHISTPTVLAPMAGVTDLPFRQLCRKFGAGLVVSEMVTADTRLWHTQKSRLRLPHHAENTPRMVQIAGSDPQMLANAAQQNVRLGAQIIDINMGCPAKKVCKRAAGSALLSNETLVADILTAVVAAVEVPVTLKIRTGANPEQRNGVTIAKIAEDCGIQALAVHGRTRACKFKGQVEYDTLADIVQSVNIPVMANGDIDSPQQAKKVLEYTKAVAVMIGRGAQGQPWIFREINHFLATGQLLPIATINELSRTALAHVAALHQHYGDLTGLRIARKHVGWYLQSTPMLAAIANNGEALAIQANSVRRHVNQLDNSHSQLSALNDFFHSLTDYQEQAA